MERLKKYITELIISKNWFDRATLTRFLMKNYPLSITTKTRKYKTVLIKKGRIREWRTYDQDGTRISPPIF